ncbi:hypothetical protein MUGA111182_15025 [Mucilaginibacter galii]|uniref:Uncharacterized protein n=1 Tax=Mucilaginibacter galii TaxID=2005073 RepID=A0A917J7H6_9SPHI|nr:hypothetical protein GCM10011425_13550 [Mucilaginibacter galii]
MKQHNLPLFATAVIAIIIVLLKGSVVINSPDKAMGALLIVYTISWLIISMLKQPFKQSWSALTNSFRLLLTFVKPN